MIQTVAFYLFSVVLITSALGVIIARNPVIAVLSLILAFFNAAGLFVLLGAEFLAMLLVIVYVGAVAVLFLFVVMMLDINFAALRAGFLRHLPLALFIGVILLVELVLIVTEVESVPPPTATADDSLTNTELLGRLLYTKYGLVFQTAGLLLLVSMIGAIVLTFRHREGVRRQSIESQIARTTEGSIVTVKVSTGNGVELP